MISSNVFYFSLLSISWISFVRAYLTPEQDIELQHFWTYGGKNFFRAVNEVRPSKLDSNYSGWLFTFKNTLGPYLEHLPDPVRNGQDQAPPPGEALGDALAGIPNLVYLLRYSNLIILKDLKKDLVFASGVYMGPQHYSG
jgi:hypothetical protein